jgi:hypothetical protein
MSDLKATFGWDASYGQRILNSRFIGITTFTINQEQSRLWWCYKTRRWVTLIYTPTSDLSTHAPCKSYKAFERHLKKHAAELYGYEVILVSRFEGHDVTARVWK